MPKKEFEKKRDDSRVDEKDMDYGSSMSFRCKS